MFQGYIFAEKVDEGFPGSLYTRGHASISIATGSVVFVQSQSLEEAIQYLIDNEDKLEDTMEGAYTSLRDLVRESESVELLKESIDKSYVDGDSAAKVIYNHVSLPALPVEWSNYFLRFVYSTYDLSFMGVFDKREENPMFQDWIGHRDRKNLTADIQLDPVLILNVKK